ncbi:unnamed protein product [Brassicogethes aeneus]|uniref:Partial AB-hydrolase lipase domain-containing protein n=1 Tax=Brassicogethes aeneus TaxID=1431903 RepID=A0A9P0B8W1_BRAAE|nr:unnamed protein product [Brassicogethes aeneus]
MYFKAICFFLFFIFIQNSLCKDPAIHGTIDEIADYYGYQTQNITVKTEDGFNLIVIRVMCKDNCSTSSLNKQPMVLWPGLLFNARFYVLNGKDSMAFHFVNEGYDVYLANYRGTIYSNNTNLSSSNAKYWDFGFGILAKNDIRQVTKTICGLTKQKLISLGHSTTTNALVAYATLYPQEVAQNHKGFILDGVTVNIYQTNTIYFPILGLLANQFRDVTYLLSLRSLDTSFTKICQYKISFLACEAIIRLVYGEYNHIDAEDSFPRFFGEGTEVIPTSIMVNLAQIIKHKGVFQDLDYGLLGNLVHYKQINAPVFDLNAIKGIRIDIICTDDNEYTCTDAKSTYDYLSVSKSYTYLPNNEKCPGHLIHYNYFICDNMNVMSVITAAVNRTALPAKKQKKKNGSSGRRRQAGRRAG